MPYVKFTGNYNEFITGRDVDSAVHYEDESDPICVGIVPTVRTGDVPIDESEYETTKVAIFAYNATLPPTPPPGAPAFKAITAAEVAALPPNGNGPLATVKAILAKEDADITQAELKTLVLLMARYFLRKWLNGWR